MAISAMLLCLLPALTFFVGAGVIILLEPNQ